MQEQYTDFQPMKACPVCARTFDFDAIICDQDGYELVVSEDDPLIGTWLLDRYVILSVLGAGGWGKVYKARHLTLGTVVAIKTLYLHLATNKEKVTRFEQEARAACALRHENIAAVYDFGTMPNGQPFIVMDFLGGENLHTRLQNEGTLEPQRAIAIFKQICSGLAAAHDRGIVHRDIKPGNIVLLPDPDRGELVKLFDFGLAKLHLEDGTSLNQLTQTGETVGTPAYMSPEQCQGWKVDHRTDLYSLGCVMYECLSGVQAFNGPTTYECMSKHVNEGAPPFSEVAPGHKIPAALEEIVFKALEKDPRRRYQNARLILDALAKAEGGYTSGTMRNIALPKAALRRPWRAAQRAFQRNKRGALYLGTSVVLLGATALLAYQSWKGYDPSQMPPPERWMHHTRQGTAGLLSGHYDEAQQEFGKALQVAETFSTSDKRRVTLANVALLHHLTNNTEKERDADKQLDMLISHSGVAREDQGITDLSEADLLSSMLDQVTSTKPLDKQQLQLVADRINRIAGRTNVPNKKITALEEKNCRLLKQYLGQDSEEYGSALQRLAYANFLDNNQEKSLELWLQCLPLRKALLKNSDPEYFELLSSVGMQSARCNKLEDAEKYLEQAAELKDSEPNVARQAATLAELAEVYRRLGNDKREYATWKRVYDLLDHSGNYDSADWPFLELVFAGNRLGINAETEQFLTSRRAALVTHYGEVSDGAAAYSLALAELYLLEHKYANAEAAAKQALEIRDMAQLPGYLQVRRTMETLARIYIAEAKYKEALGVYNVILACAERNIAADNDKGILLDALSKCAYLNSKLGNQKQAADYMLRFHVLLAGMQPAPRGYDCTRPVDAVFTALKGMGLTSQDYLQLEQLIEAQTAVSDRDGSVTAAPNPKLSDAMSRVLALSGRFRDAQSADEKAIDQLKTNFPTYAWIPGRVYSHYAQVLNELGKTDQAKQAAQEAAKYPQDPV